MIDYVVCTQAYLQQLFSDDEKTDARKQLEALTQKHQDEIVVHKHVQKLNPDWPRYRELARQDRIFMVLAFSAGKIVGYIVVFVQKHLHDRELIYAMDDLYYIDPDVRGAGLGAGLITAAEKEAVRRGAKLLLLRTKQHTNFGGFLEHIGYRPFETVYTKELDHDLAS